MADVGHFIAWDGGCVLIGKQTAPVPPHAHQAVQMVFVPDASHYIRLDRPSVVIAAVREVVRIVRSAGEAVECNARM